MKDSFFVVSYVFVFKYFNNKAFFQVTFSRSLIKDNKKVCKIVAYPDLIMTGSNNKKNSEKVRRKGVKEDEKVR